MRFISLLAILIGTFGASGQTAPRFDAASVKPSPPWQPGMNGGVTLDGEFFTSKRNPLRSLIMIAYDVTPRRISGAPAWLESDLFDIVATLPHGSPKEQVKPMLQALLADRSSLTFHREMRDYPIYALIIAKDGAKLKPSGQDQPSSIKTSKGHLEMRHTDLETLAKNLTAPDRPVLDTTGLKGFFDITLDWSPDDTGPSIFTAIQEQLGLKLEPGKSPIEFIVIDNVEKPSAN
jgi:bla regulator protein BlaR1